MMKKPGNNGHGLPPRLVMMTACGLHHVTNNIFPLELRVQIVTEVGFF
jgi:hypothetical protein